MRDINSCGCRPGPPARYRMPPTHSSGLQQLNARAEAAADLGRRGYPNSYAGVAVNGATDTVIVYRVPDPAYDHALAIAVHGRLDIRDVTHSGVALDHWVDTLIADLDYWTDRGTPVNAVGPRPTDDCVLVGLDHPDRDGPVVRAHYPAASSLLCIEHSGGADLLVPGRN